MVSKVLLLNGVKVFCLEQTKVGCRMSSVNLIIIRPYQGSILCILSIFINDLPSICRESTPYLFADDGALYFDNFTRGSYRNATTSGVTTGPADPASRGGHPRRAAKSVQKMVHFLQT